MFSIESVGYRTMDTLRYAKCPNPFVNRRTSSDNRTPLVPRTVGQVVVNCVIGGIFDNESPITICKPERCFDLY